MGNVRPLDTKCWISFIEYHGFTESGRSKGSHHIWVKRNSPRSIPVWKNKKQIPIQHLKTGCFTIGCTLSELFDWVDANC